MTVYLRIHLAEILLRLLKSSDPSLILNVFTSLKLTINNLDTF